MTKAKTDQAVANLLAAVNERKERVRKTTEELKGRKWKTNLTLRKDPNSPSGSVNIATINRREDLVPWLVFLLGMQKEEEIALQLLGLPEKLGYLGYPIEDWISDICLRNNKLVAREEERKLEQMEEKAKNLLGEEQKRVRELNRLQAEFDEK